jgi:hypothetical protein
LIAAEIHGRQWKQPSIYNVLRQLCSRAIKESRPDFCRSKGHRRSEQEGEIEGGRTYLPDVDKSTLARANQNTKA